MSERKMRLPSDAVLVQRLRGAGHSSYAIKYLHPRIIEELRACEHALTAGVIIARIINAIEDYSRYNYPLSTREMSIWLELYLRAVITDSRIQTEALRILVQSRAPE